MRDTSIENTLFHAEFPNAPDLQDIFDFLQHRFTPDELLRSVKFSYEQMENLYQESSCLESFSVDDMAEEIIDSGGLTNPGAFIKKLIMDYEISAKDLFTDEDIRQDFKILFEDQSILRKTNSE